MDYRIFLPMLVLAIFGIFLIATELSGFVVSQTCCFLPNCNPENICRQVAKTNPVGAYAGISLLAASISIYLILYKRK